MPSQDAILTLLLENQKLLSDLSILARKWHETMRRMDSAVDEVEFLRLSREASQLESKMDQVGREASQSIQKIERATKGASGSFLDLNKVVGKFKGLLAAAGFTLGAREIVQFAKSSVEASIRLEAFRAQLAASTKTLAEANELFDFANAQTERLGLGFATVVEGTARFAAATKNSNLTLEQRKEILLSVFEASRVLNLSEQRLNNTLLALEQIASKAFVSMEELRRQLGDNVPGAVAILATQLGVSTQKLLKMIESNQVLSEEALPALARGFTETFGAGLQGSLDTTAARLGRLQKQVFDFRIAFAEGFSEELKKSVDDIAQSISDMEPAATRAGRGVAKLIESVSALVASFERTNEALKESGGEGHLLLSLLALISDEYIDASGNVQRYSDHVKILSENLDQNLRTSLKLLVEALESVSAAEEDSIERSERLSDASTALVGAINAAQRAGKLQGEQLLDLVDKSDRLRELYGDEMPPNIQRLIDSLESLLTTEQKAAREAEKLAESEKKAASAALEASQAFAKRAAAADEAATSLLGDQKALESHTQATIDAIRNITGAGDELGKLTKEQFEAIQEEIQSLLDSWAKLGVDAPASLQSLADQLGVTTTVAEEELEKQSKAAEKAAKEEEQAAKRRIQSLERIGDAFLKLSQQLTGKEAPDGLKDLQNRLEELKSEAEDLTFGPEADLERLAEVEAEIESVREQIRGFKVDQEELGEATQETADVIDDAIRGLIDQMVPLLGQLSTTQEANIKSILGNLQSLGQTGDATSDDIAIALQRISTEFEAAGLPVEHLQDALAELQTGTLDIEKAFAAAIREFEEGGEALGDVRSRIDELKDANKELFTEVAKGEALWKKFADTADSELKRAATAYDALLTRQERSLDLCAALKNCLAGAG